MNRLFLATAAVLTLAIVTPANAFQSTASPERIQLSQAGVSINVGGDRDRRAGTTVVRKKVVIRDRDRDVRRKRVVIRQSTPVRRGWSHSKHHGATKKVVITKRPASKTVIRSN